MKGTHPIDELFAQGLRDAEATPPPAVWEGIVRERGWGHRALLILQRRWGLLALLLLVGGGSAAVLVAGTNAPEQAPVVAAMPELPSTTTAQTATATAILDPQQTPVTSHRSALPSATSDNLAAAGSDLAASDGAAPARGNTEHTTGTRTDEPHRADELTGASITTAAALHQRGAHVPNIVTAEPVIGANGTTSHTTLGDGPATTDKSAALTPSGAMETAMVIAETRTDDLERAWFITPVLLAPEHPLAAGMLTTGQAPEHHPLPKGEYWLGVNVGLFSERRTWKSDDPVLGDALNGTETPHYPYSIGLALGREWNSGFGVSTGVDYSFTRSDFHHRDHLVDRQELVTSFIVTLDTVVYTYAGDTTLVLVNERSKDVSAVNTTTAIRVPLEVSYHQNWRRWSIGPRVGLVGEFVTSRSGLTLKANATDGSVYSVNAAGDRSSAVLSWSASLDIGFMLTEHISLWAAPVYMRGIGSLGGHGDAYMLPERPGVRFGLSYTFPRR